MDDINFTIYSGKLWDIVPRVSKAGLILAGVAEIMDLRSSAIESGDESLIAKIWGSDFIDSTTGLIYHPDGRVKINPRSSNLRNLTPNSAIYRDATLNLEANGANVQRFEDLPDQINGVQLVFTREELEQQRVGHYLTRDEVINNQVWLALAEGDQKRLERYVRSYQNLLSVSDYLPPMKLDIEELKSGPQRECLWSFTGVRAFGLSIPDARVCIVNSYDATFVGVEPEFAKVIQDGGKNRDGLASFNK